MYIYICICMYVCNTFTLRIVHSYDLTGYATIVVLHPLTASHHFVMDADANATGAVDKDGNDLLNVPQCQRQSTSKRLNFNLRELA